jgi:hypothetical protein
MTRGRKLTLYFAEKERPMLSKTVFWYSTEYQRQENPDIEWMSGARALSIFLVDYLIHATKTRGVEFSQSARLGDGSHLHTLADLLETMNAQWLVHCFLAPGDRNNGQLPISGEDVAHSIFRPNRGDCRSHSKARRHGAWRRVRVQSSELPPDCIEINWDGKRVKRPDAFKKLRAGLKRQTEGDPGDSQGSISKQAIARIVPPDLCDGVHALAERACSASRDIRRQTHINVQNAPTDVREAFLRSMLFLTGSAIERIRGEAYYCLGEITLPDHQRTVSATFLTKGLADRSTFVRACCANVLCHFIPLPQHTVRALKREIALHLHENTPGTSSAGLIYYASRTLNLHEEVG